LGHYFKGQKSLRNVISLFSPIFVWTTILALAPLQISLTVLAPAVVLYMIAVEVINFPHHLGLPQSKGDAKLPAWEQHQTARSCIYPEWFAKFFALNFNYHIEHHMFPDAPWYYLDKLHLEVKEELKSLYNTDPQFAWILNNRPKDLADVLITAKSDESQKQAA
ncbi:MAG: fatty acid desaturase, partial [Pseudobdellovibrionaceae bacterium]